VGTDVDSEDASMNLEVAKQFAKEKQLEFQTCDIEDQGQVDSTVLNLIRKIMGSWENNDQSGECWARAGVTQDRLVSVASRTEVFISTKNCSACSVVLENLYSYHVICSFQLDAE